MADLVVAVAVLSLLQAFVVRLHQVSSGSMEQTLGVGDRVLASPLPYLFGAPARGDVVAFAHGSTWESRTLPPSADPAVRVARFVGGLTGIGPSSRAYTVKRVIGVGGDRVGCCDASGHVVVNGHAIDEPYVYQDIDFRPGQFDCSTTPRSPRCFPTVQVPPDELLLLGDHRSNSADSLTDCRTAAPAVDCAHFVHVEQVTGKVAAKAWPPGPIG
ncbi:signal peptidase I [Raineyella sp.]|nr:signal peptidase I [Raineyella sp.]MEA5153885.1 signal peptidase I [Raineyella sp.]